MPEPLTRLGPFELLARLGRGGMGEVWRARDTRLEREVAVKIPAQQFTDRFTREARTVAALNHPSRGGRATADSFFTPTELN